MAGGDWEKERAGNWKNILGLGDGYMGIQESGIVTVPGLWGKKIKDWKDIVAIAGNAEQTVGL